MRTVYICHPYSDDPARNVARVREICRSIAGDDLLPVAPHLFLPQFVDDATSRDLAMVMCLRLVDACDSIAVIGREITAGMRQEIDHAEATAKPIIYVPTPDTVADARTLARRAKI